MLWVSVLGPHEVHRGEQRLRVPAGKASELLVRLALQTGELVSTERLILDLWAAEAERTRPNTMQSKVAMLRRSLGDAMACSAARRGVCGWRPWASRCSVCVDEAGSYSA